MTQDQVIEVTTILSAIDGNIKRKPSPHDYFLLFGIGIFEPLNELFEQYPESEEAQQWEATREKALAANEAVQYPTDWRKIKGDDEWWIKTLNETLLPPLLSFREYWYNLHAPEMLKPSPNGLDFNAFKEMFDRSFAKVTPQEFIKRMEELGYEFEDIEDHEQVQAKN